VCLAVALKNCALLCLSDLSMKLLRFVSEDVWGGAD
jgi:hypothetical protein